MKTSTRAVASFALAAGLLFPFAGVLLAQNSLLNNLTSQVKGVAAALPEDQVAAGLKEALAKGVQKAVTQLGASGGFLTNLNVKIGMPESLQKVEKTLRKLKQEALADEFVTTMNRAAEMAVPEAASVFGEGIKQMTVADAKAILGGPDDSATQYFRRTSTNALQKAFLPLVKQATEKAGVTSAYKAMMDKVGAGSLGRFGGALGALGVNQDATDIDAYVTRKAMDGLFKVVADEEKAIRKNPVARTTDLLKQVFGGGK